MTRIPVIAHAESEDMPVVFPRVFSLEWSGEGNFTEEFYNEVASHYRTLIPFNEAHRRMTLYFPSPEWEEEWGDYCFTERQLIKICETTQVSKIVATVVDNKEESEPILRRLWSRFKKLKGQ